MNRTLLMPSLSASLFYKEVELLRPISFDHWPVKDHSEVFECLVLADEIMREADRVMSRIREIGAEQVRSKRESAENSLLLKSVPYVAVHMRIELDWMIHCKNLERRLNITDICSRKGEIMERVGNIVGLKTPAVVYLAVADSLLQDPSILNGWRERMIPFEKKKLGFDARYKKFPYLIQSAIDY
ncbi:O-fucosyltransferase 23-like [Rosa chinensis]|uniref:O-fucosyltransferase 23-like n=1 Tax=Rosa chinensis TaxID=74649 RepID=UPI001AD92AD8|nr:O-fucosyltransferase 23-like [Rosa chinensis]